MTHTGVVRRVPAGRTCSTNTLSCRTICSPASLWRSPAVTGCSPFGRGWGRCRAVTTVVRETERKYELADGAELPGWDGLIGVQALVGPEEQALEAVYFDTEDLRLARAGVTLRRRLGGQDAGWHLKLPVAGDSRDEVRVGDARAL